MLELLELSVSQLGSLFGVKQPGDKCLHSGQTLSMLPL